MIFFLKVRFESSHSKIIYSSVTNWMTKIFDTLIKKVFWYISARRKLFWILYFKSKYLIVQYQILFQPNIFNINVWSCRSLFISACHSLIGWCLNKYFSRYFVSSNGYRPDNIYQAWFNQTKLHDTTSQWKTKI